MKTRQPLCVAVVEMRAERERGNVNGALSEKKGEGWIVVVVLLSHSSSIPTNILTLLKVRQRQIEKDIARSCWKIGVECRQMRYN
jgi:hypothetical protein